MGEKLSVQGWRLVRGRAAAALLLLALTTHAFVASATHFHRFAGAVPHSVQASVGSRRGDTPQAPLAGEDSRCLLCRLQRSLISDVQNGSVLLLPPAAGGVDYCAFQKNSLHTASSPRRPGRATRRGRVLTHTGWCL